MAETKTQEKVILKPGVARDGSLLKLRDPVRMDFVPAHGREVAMSTYWTRRLACGDAIKISAIDAAAPAPEAAPSAPEAAPADAPAPAAPSRKQKS